MNPGAGIETPSMAEQIRQAVQEGKLSLPPLPELANRALDMLREPDTMNARELAHLIENDPAMTASILHIANSAAFGGLRAVSELDQAVARLGVQQVAAVLTTVAHRGNFDIDSQGKKQLLYKLWDHAVATAVAAKHLAAMGGAERGEAFLAGLLHDTGKLLVLRGVDDYEKGSGTAVSAAVLDELMDMLHTELGYGVLVSWNIADPVCQVALKHHEEDPETDNYLLLRVQAANAIARKLGAHPHPDPDLNLLEIQAIERLHLSDLEIASVLVDLEDAISDVHKLL